MKSLATSIRLLGICFCLVFSVAAFAVDTDGDGLPDDWEIAHGRNPNVADYTIYTQYIDGTGYALCAKDDTGTHCWTFTGTALAITPFTGNAYTKPISWPGGQCAFGDSMGDCSGANYPQYSSPDYCGQMGGNRVICTKTCSGMQHYYQTLSYPPYSQCVSTSYSEVSATSEFDPNIWICHLDQKNGFQCYAVDGFGYQTGAPLNIPVSFYIDSDGDGVPRPYDYDDLDASVFCASGQYWNGSVCTSASAGYYVPDQHSTSQTACAVGNYQPATSQSSCIPASAGYYVSGTGNTAQTFCSAGTYQPLTGQTSCNTSTPVQYCSAYSAIVDACTACSTGYSVKEGICLQSQAITVTTPAPASANSSNSFIVTATASSGLPVSITSSGGCSGSGSGNVTITMASSGSTACNVYYNQSGNGTYAAAAQVSSSTGVTTLLPQTITVTTAAPVSAAYDNTFIVAATANSGLPVSITVSGGCSHYIFAGDRIAMTSSTTPCTVYYNQAGNATYAAAPQVTSVTAVAGSPGHPVKNDFDDDGKSDVLFINSASSATQYWKAATKADKVSPGTVNVGYVYAGSGDFDGDGKADLFFTKAATNTTLVWGGAAKATASYPGSITAGFTVAAICDVDGDKKDDVVWYNATTGATRVWSGAVKTAVTYPGTQNTAYTVAACADFDGDGKADIFWHNATTGANQIWLGASKAAKTNPGTLADVTWTPVGAGDVDADGKADFIWYRVSTRGTQIWNGGLKAAVSYPGTGASGFTPKAIGDYDGDGKADLLWGNDTTLATQIWPSCAKSGVKYPGTSLAGFTIQK